MITNLRQYALAERKLKICISLRKRLMRRQHLVFNQAETQQKIDNLQRQAELITEQMKDYIGLSMGCIAVPDLSGISNLPHNLIRARIALGWNQQEFGRQAGVAPSQVHR